MSNRLKHVTAKVWNTRENPGTFPELTDDDVKDPWLSGDRKKVGVCFSGGGSRSAAATLGQLCALNELQLIDKIGYISSVSGGSWCSLPFTYLPEHHNDSEFLGRYLEPGDIHLDGADSFDPQSFGALLADCQVIDDVIKQGLKGAGDETFSRAICDELMNQLGINGWPQFFTRSEESYRHIIERNPKMTRSDFQIARPRRPFHIAGGTIMRLSNSPALEKFHFEMTPLYVGVNSYFPMAGSGSRHIGGGYVEPFGFDSNEPDELPDSSGYVKVRVGSERHRFSLSDVMGTTGAAPAEFTDRWMLGLMGFPEFRYWSPSEPTRSAREYDFGDGGHLENLGLLALVKRNVEKIIVFINTRDELTNTSINDSIPTFFQGCAPKGWSINEVFPKAEYETLRSALLAKKHAEKTVMHRMKHTVKSNSHYGIEGGRQIEILWVYNERVTEWERKLPQATRDEIAHGSLSNFPHYRTFFQNATGIIDLSKRQVTLLKQLSAWNVMSNRDVFEQMLSP